jgi:cysteine desulfurase
MYNRLPNTTDIAFEYIEGESILMLPIKPVSRRRAVRPVLPAPGTFACDAAMDIPYTARTARSAFRSRAYNTWRKWMVLKVMLGIVATFASSPYWDGNGPVADPEKAFATYA